MDPLLHTVIFVNGIVGTPGPVILDTQIHSHNIFSDIKYDPSHDFLQIGKLGAKISLDDVYFAFSTAKTRPDFAAEFQSDRTYIFQGFHAGTSPNQYYISWGS